MPLDKKSKVLENWVWLINLTDFVSIIIMLIFSKTVSHQIFLYKTEIAEIWLLIVNNSML